jgi:hypothetical protein
MLFVVVSLLKNICSLLMFVGLFNPFIHLLEQFGSNEIKLDQIGLNWTKKDQD